MGELKVARSPDSLEIRGLGSCIALALYDPLQRIAGLAHVVIPRPLENAPPTPGWAATDAVPALIEMLERHGARASRLIARLAGGASMFPGNIKGFEVGRENADVVERLLLDRRIPVLSRQVGGHASRRVRLHADTGRFEVESISTQPMRPRPRREDPTEVARTLLEAAVAPLSDILQRPVAVDSTGRHELAGAEIVSFLGRRTPLRWSQLAYVSAAGADQLHLVIPDIHAHRIDAELRARLDDAGEEGSAVTEVLNIMLSHVLTALAKMQNRTLRPESLTTHRGTTPDVVESLGPVEDDMIAVAHARIHLQDAFRGAELALLARRLP